MKNKRKVHLPYIDRLLEAFEKNEENVKTSFGRHIHWGYWQTPGRTTPNAAEFSQAAECLSAQICNAAGIRDGQTILDTGCGFGGTLAYLNENYRGLKLSGLNLDERQLQRAKAIVTPLKDNQLSFYQGDACHLPFQDESFDVVLAVECIFHFADRHRFLIEASRVLRSGGCLALSDFVPVKWLAPFLKTASSGPFKTGFYGKCDVQCTAEQYRALAEKTGFSVRIEKDITENTLPTYRFLRKSDGRLGTGSMSAFVGTLAAEWLSKLTVLKYMIVVFGKDG
ncbi:MAG: class I SAM-dependent methyltransferase [Gammaproteobacteria bacterium]